MPCSTSLRSQLRYRPAQLLVVVLLATLAAACVAQPADQEAPDSTGSTRGELTRCARYPLAVPGSTTHEAAARAELASSSPGATLVWARSRDTLASVQGMSMVLTCDEDLGKTLLEHLQTSPALYQVRTDEWRTEPLPCGALTQATYVRFDRTRLGGVAVAKDVLSLRVAPLGRNRVEVQAAIGFYLPPAAPLLAASLQGCNKSARADAATSARQSRFAYTEFDVCAPVKSHAYAPAADDSVSVGNPDVPIWTWEDDANGVVLRAERRGYVHVTPNNRTPDLLRSDAHCPLQGSVGFLFTADAVTGELLDQKAGIDCIVCAR
jgi:hypothetical protein